VSAQDIPNTNFWDEEIPGMLPFATAWPDIGPSTGMAPEAFNTSQAWQRLCDDLAKVRCCLLLCLWYTAHTIFPESHALLHNNNTFLATLGRLSEKGEKILSDVTGDCN
jgi:hypothetical protein